MMTYELQKAYKNAERVRTYAARFAIAAGLALMLASLSFAGQAGIGLASRLADHQHTGAGDGAQLMGLNPVGNFFINTNSEGNIVIGSAPTGGVFYWRPKRQAFRAGLASDDSFYDINVGSYSWAGGYNSSAGSYSLGFGTYVKADRVANIALGYYLKSTADNTVTLGSGPGFGPDAYAVNNATGSIQFFPFTITASTEAMLALYRDGKARATGTWNFTDYPTVNGLAISTSPAIDTTRVAKSGDTMTGTLIVPNVTATSATITTGNFSVGAGTYAVIANNGLLGVGTTPGTNLHVKGNVQTRFYLDHGNTGWGRLQFITGQTGTTIDGILNNAASASDIYLNPSGGRVAVGNSAPTAALDVTGGISASGVIISSGTGVSSIAGPVKLYNSGTNAILSVGAAGGANRTVADDNYINYGADADFYASIGTAGAFRVRSGPNGGALEKFRVNGNGNVGIGTATPTSQLTIGAGGQSWVDGYASGVYAVSQHASALSSGTVVTYSDFGTSLAITTAAANSDVPVGTIYDQSCAAGARCRICLTGICPARLITTGACARAADQYVVAGSETGRAECVTAPAAAIHNREIGQPASWSAVNGDTILIWAHRN